MKEKLWFSKDRLIALIDGIFAFSMTLLVITIDVPSIKNVFSNQDLVNALYDLLPSIGIYILSFILLANLWILNHKYFISIKKVDNSFTWLNIFYLLFIVLFPFTTDLVGEFGGLPMSNIVFHANNLIIGILNFVIWNYAVKNNLIDENVNKQSIFISFHKSYIFPSVALLALISSNFITSYSNFFYLLIPALKIFIDKKYAQSS